MKNFDFSDDFFFLMGSHGGCRNVFQNFILKFLSVDPDRFGFGCRPGQGWSRKTVFSSLFRQTSPRHYPRIAKLSCNVAHVHVEAVKMQKRLYANASLRFLGAVKPVSGSFLGGVSRRFGPKLLYRSAGFTQSGAETHKNGWNAPNWCRMAPSNRSLHNFPRRARFWGVPKLGFSRFDRLDPHRPEHEKGHFARPWSDPLSRSRCGN